MTRVALLQTTKIKNSSPTMLVSLEMLLSTRLMRQHNAKRGLPSVLRAVCSRSLSSMMLHIATAWCLANK